MNDSYFMNIAYKEAKKALQEDEIPVGAIIVENGNIISKAYNRKNQNNIITSHAEIDAIIKANKKKKNWRLVNCTMYVTLEPCDMCKEVIIESRIKKVIYATPRKIEKKIKESLITKIEDAELLKLCEEIIIKQFKSIRDQL